jgi:hypothetical protein
MIYFRTKLIEKFLAKLPQSGKPEQIRGKYEITPTLQSETYLGFHPESFSGV